ncbi:MAG: DUF2061 domain-containing protein [Candidatus Micrarchaeota archaeon]
MNERKKRSVLNAITYRIICIIVLALVTYRITGDLVQMTYIVVVFQSIQLFVYYFHERAWGRVKWGYK